MTPVYLFYVGLQLLSYLLLVHIYWPIISDLFGRDDQHGRFGFDASGCSNSSELKVSHLTLRGTEWLTRKQRQLARICTEL